MNREEIRNVVVKALSSIAPETDAAVVDPKRSLREQLDLDSMDFLNFVVLLHEKLHVDVAERDYARLDSLDGCVDYVLGSARSGA